MDASMLRHTGLVQIRPAHYIPFLMVTQTYQPYGSPRPAHAAVAPFTAIGGKLFDSLARAQVCEPVGEACVLWMTDVGRAGNGIMVPRLWGVWRSFAMMSRMQLQAGLLAGTRGGPGAAEPPLAWCADRRQQKAIEDYLTSVSRAQASKAFAGSRASCVTNTCRTMPCRSMTNVVRRAVWFFSSYTP